MLRTVWRTGRGFLPLILLLLLSSCATLSRQECQGANWHDIGESDGSKGLPLSRISRHADACRRFSIVPDRQAWMEGHRIGARRFCTPANAFALGVRGGKNHGICQADQRAAFESVYKLGRRHHELASEIRSLEFQIESAKSRIDEVRQRRKKGKLSAGEADAEIDSLHRDIVSDEIQLERARNDLARFKQRLLRDGYMKMAIAD